MLLAKHLDSYIFQMPESATDGDLIDLGDDSLLETSKIPFTFAAVPTTADQPILQCSSQLADASKTNVVPSSISNNSNLSTSAQFIVSSNSSRSGKLPVMQTAKDGSDSFHPPVPSCTPANVSLHNSINRAESYLPSTNITVSQSSNSVTLPRERWQQFDWWLELMIANQNSVSTHKWQSPLWTMRLTGRDFSDLE